MIRAFLCAALLLIAAPPSVLAAPEGSIRLGITNLPPARGNPYQANGPPSSIVWSALFDALTRVDGDGALVPALALSWETVEPTRWRFTLRPDVRFSNGEAFDSAAVKAVLDWLRSDAGRRTVIATELRTVRAVEIVDRLTVDIVTAAPDALLPKRLTAVHMVPPRAWARLGPDGFALEPSGTGPFVVDGPFDGDGGILRVTAHADSWRPPHLAEMVFIELPDSAARLQALLSGQVDMARGFPPEQSSLIEERGLALYVRDAPSVLSLAFDVTGNPEHPIADIRVRQALNYAVNKDAIIAAALSGYGGVPSQGTTRTVFGYNPALEPYPHDPDKARALLAEAGYADGFEMVAEVVIGSFPNDSIIYQAVAQDLARIGVGMEVRGMVFPTWIRQYLAGDWNGQAFGLSWNALPYYDAQRPIEYFSCAKANPFYCDEALMPLIREAGAELDETAREALLHRIMAEKRRQAPSIFLIEQQDLLAYHPRLQDVRLVGRVVPYEEITIAD